MHDPLTPKLRELVVRVREQVEREQAEKAEMFFRLFFDPALAPYVSRLRDYFLQLPEELPQERIDVGPAVTRIPFVAPAGFNTGNGIQRAITSLALPETFTGHDILSQLTASRFPFSKRDPRGAIRDALLRLSRGDDAPFKIVTEGKGGKPNVYTRRAA